MKETVILEYIDVDKVSVIPYDEEEELMGLPVEVTKKNFAIEKYNVVGELIDGEVKLFKNNYDNSFEDDNYDGDDLSSEEDE